MGSGGQIKGQHMPKVQPPQPPTPPPPPPPAPAPNPGWPANYRLVGPTETALGREARAYRDRHQLWNGINVAVVEYVDAAGQRQTHAAQSANGRHSERNALDQLAAMGVPLENIREIYTEREPCIVPANCCALLQNLIPNAQVSFSYEYGEAQASRDRGNEAIRGDVNDARPPADPGTPEPTVQPRQDRGEPATDGSDIEQAENRIMAEQLAAHFKDDPQVLQVMNGVMQDKPLYQIQQESGMKPAEFRKAMARFRAESKAFLGGD